MFAGAGPGGFTQWSRLKAMTGASSPVVKRYGWATVGAIGGDGQHPTDAYFKCTMDMAFDLAGDVRCGPPEQSDPGDVARTASSTPWAASVRGTNTGVHGPRVLVRKPEMEDRQRMGVSMHRGVGADPDGNLFIADRDHDAIREIDTHGTLTTVAGTGQRGFNGDHQPATEAMLARPLAVAFDADGNLYISDENNYRIRKVDTHGVITTFAGTGTYGCGGDGGPAVDASLRNPNDIVIAPDGSMLDQRLRVPQRPADRPRRHDLDVRGRAASDVVSRTLRPTGPEDARARRGVLRLRARRRSLLHAMRQPVPRPRRRSGYHPPVRESTEPVRI